MLGSLEPKFPFNVSMNALCIDLEATLQSLDVEQRQELNEMRKNYDRIIKKCQPNAKTPMDSMIFMSPNEETAWMGNQKSQGINHPFLLHCPNHESFDSLDKGLYYLEHESERSMTKTTLCFPSQLTRRPRFLLR